MDLHKAITYIQQTGNLVEIARLSSILWADPPSEEVFKELEKLQKTLAAFVAALDDDGNISAALASLVDLVRVGNLRILAGNRFAFDLRQ